MPKVKAKREKEEGGSEGNPNKKVNAGDVHDLLTSAMSKPGGCTLPEIGNGRLMKQHTGNTKQHAGGGEVVPTHLPPLPAKAVAQQQVKKVSKRSSTSGLRLDSQRHQLCRLGFEEQKAVKEQGNKEGKQLKPDRLIPLLPPIENTTQSSSSSTWAAGHRPRMDALRPPTELHSFRKLPDIKNAPVKRSRPKSGDLHGPLSVLPPISQKPKCRHV